MMMTTMFWMERGESYQLLHRMSSELWAIRIQDHFTRDAKYQYFWQYIDIFN